MFSPTNIISLFSLYFPNIISLFSLYFPRDLLESSIGSKISLLKNSNFELTAIFVYYGQCPGLVGFTITCLDFSYKPSLVNKFMDDPDIL